jgi:hypothetical protein
MSLVETFKKQARWTWRQLSFARKASLPLSEESLTDWNLLQIARAHPAQIRIEAFNKRVEGREGADWEWWLCSGKTFIGFRMQAKRLDNDGLHYAHIHYRSGAQPQVDLLCQRARARGCIPLYVLYNFWNYRMKKSNWGTDSRHDAKQLFGCSFLDPTLVKEMHPETGIAMFLPYQEPWYKLVDHSPGEDDLPNAAAVFMSHLSSWRREAARKGMQFSQPENQTGYQEYITQHPPGYVLQLQHKEGTADLPRDIQGAVLIDEA